MTHGSGDYVIAFSTHPGVRAVHSRGNPLETKTALRDSALSPLFQATREATEEAVVNSLLRATAVTGFRGRVLKAVPIDRVAEICRRHGVIGGQAGENQNGGQARPLTANSPGT